MSTPTQNIEVDDRGRTTLRGGVAPAGSYRQTLLPGGSVLLEPARLVTEAELAYLRDPDLAARVDRSIDHPETRVRRGRLPRVAAAAE